MLNKCMDCEKSNVICQQIFKGENIFYKCLDQKQCFLYKLINKNGEYWIGPLGIKIPLTINKFPDVDGYNTWEMKIINDFALREAFVHISHTNIPVKNPKYTPETFLNTFSENNIYNGAKLPMIPHYDSPEFINDLLNIYGPMWKGPANVLFPWTKTTNIPNFDGNIGTLVFYGYKYELLFTEVYYEQELTPKQYRELYAVKDKNGDYIWRN
jgi:hypothetical protein